MSDCLCWQGIPGAVESRMKSGRFFVTLIDQMRPKRINMNLLLLLSLIII